MNILVTGGAGYIGSMLTPKLLKAGHNVRVLDSLLFGGEGLLGSWSDPQFDFIRGDIRNPACVAAAVEDVDAIVHLAAIVGDPACSCCPEVAEEVNLEAAKKLFLAARRAGVGHFISASTCSNYGAVPSDSYATEATVLQPLSLYSRTKVEFENFLQECAFRSDSPTFSTLLRFATVYGVSPRMRFDLTVNDFVRELVTKKKLEVYMAESWRPYIHVRDVCRAILLVLSSRQNVVLGEVYNVGATEENYQKKQIAELVLQHVQDAEVEYVQKGSDPRDYRVSFDKIRRDLTYFPSRTVPDGILEVLQLIKNRCLPNVSDSKYGNC